MEKQYLKLAGEYLTGRYDPDLTDIECGRNKYDFLVDSIVPSERLAISGKGALIITSHGNLIDFQSMTVNCILGQNDPWVKLQQIAYLISNRPSFHTTKLGSELYYSLPRRLVELRVGGISEAVVSHRQSNGSDAMEHAVKAASIRHPHRKGLVSFRGSYHGQNMTAYAISDIQSRHRFLSNTPTVTYFPAPNSADRLDGDACLTINEAAELDQLDMMGQDVFAVVVEPIQMNNGVQPFSSIFLKALRDICTKRDICLIFDEIQTGIGWLGYLTAAELIGVVPDMIALSKALTAGNGPLALTITSQSYKSMEYGTASKTNGADVRSLVAAHAVLDRLLGLPDELIPDFIEGQLRYELQTGLLNAIPSLSEKLRRHAEAIVTEFSCILGMPRGYGLICGLPIIGSNGKADPDLASKISNECFERGLFLRTSGPSCLLIKVPAVISDKQLDDGFNILRDSILAVNLTKKTA